MFSIEEAKRAADAYDRIGHADRVTDENLSEAIRITEMVLIYL